MKIVKPTVNQDIKPTPGGSQVPVEVEKAENSASIPEERGRFISENLLDKRMTMQDGSYRVYKIQGPVADDPLFKGISRFLGLEGSEEARLTNEIGEIAELAATWLQSDRHDVVTAFLRQVLRRTSFDGSNNVSKIQNLRKKLLAMSEDIRKEKDVK